MRHNQLTHEQRDGRTTAQFDLCIGYPELEIDGETRNFINDCLADSVRRSGVPGRSQGFTQTDFNVVLAKLLAINETFVPFVEVTFSGSVALQRAIAASQIIAKRKTATAPHFVVVEPCIDIYSSMLDESGLSYEGFTRPIGSSRNDWLPLLEQRIGDIVASRPQVVPVLMIDSPSNPFGENLCSEDLLRIQNFMADAGGVVIFDHCFALAGIHEFKELPLPFQLPAPGCDWIAVWDTGKTYDLNGDKIGVLISSDADAHDAVVEALETIQVGASSRDLAFFGQFLADPSAQKVLETLQRECRRNLSLLLESPSYELVVLPEGGTFATLQLPPGVSSVHARNALLERGLSVSSGASFSFRHKSDLEFIRLSLARTHSVFSAAVELLEPFSF